MAQWHTTRLPDEYNLLAPDGSEIRLLTSVARGSMVHCTLRPAQVTQAVRHRSVEELWYCTAGSGQLWRSDGTHDETTELTRGVSASIPIGTAFQFRATGLEPLELLITTMPPWPGPDEAVAVPGAWQPTPAGAPTRK